MVHLGQLKWRKVIRSRSLRNSYVMKFDDPMTDDVKEKRIFSPDKIFTASKATESLKFRCACKILVDAKNRSH